MMSSNIQIGSVLRGKYRVERVLGVGGMGTVFAAWHGGLGQRVAIKVLLPAMLQHPGVLERFRREAQAASRIRSEHVARVIDVDAFDDGVPFMVMEYLDGRDLSSARGTGVEHEVAVEYVLQACDAIAEAHSLGIIHRDLKPANLFLTRTREGKPCVKVLDFGISKTGGPDDPNSASVTKTTAVLGSAEYMSPEQMLSTRDVDLRTDIWALGVTLYELCTGEVPFPGNTLTQVCALVMSQQPAPPRCRRPQIPEGLETVILRCLEKDREQRYANVAELVEALAPFAGVRSAETIAKLAHATGSGAQARPEQPSSGTLMLPVSPPTLNLGAAPITGGTEVVSPRIEASAPANVPRSIATTGGASTAEQAPVLPRGSSIVPMVAAVVVVLGALVGATLWWIGRGPVSAAQSPVQSVESVAPPSSAGALPGVASSVTLPVAAASATTAIPSISSGGPVTAAPVNKPAGPRKPAGPTRPAPAALPTTPF
jgi:serine/threonine-protein kinase